MKHCLLTNKIISIIFVFNLLLGIKPAHASHIAGGEITYTCLGNDQYEIHLNLFVDCLGFDPGSSQAISFNSTCGGITSAILNVIPDTSGVNFIEISQLCPLDMPNSACSGGILPGMWLFRYVGVVTLSPACDAWTMSWTTCCRNAAISNLSVPSSSFYIEATLNSATAPCNSSPQFVNHPIPYVCIGQPVNYSYGAVETDGDSLYYELVSALGTDSTNYLSYSNPYSAASPIPGITIDSITGNLNFTPTTIGNFVVVMRATEYDANGNVVGTVMRDMQFVVQNCTNIIPADTAGAITSLTGNAVQTGPYSLEICPNNNFNFTATYVDANAGDSLSFLSNITTALPGATITQVGTSANPLTLNINWNPPPNSQGQNLTFAVIIKDNACPIWGAQGFVYNIHILNSITTNPDMTICGSQTAQLNAYGGSIFNWSVISGPPITSANFSCNPCSNPIASPNATTAYQVISNVNSCINTDTIVVNVVPDFSFTAFQSTTSACLEQPIQLDVINLNPSVSGYSFQWMPNFYLDSSMIQNPTSTIISSGNYIYTVAVASPNGCIKTDTLSLQIGVNHVPAITISASDTLVCAGQTVQLGTLFTSAVPASCGPSATAPGCSTPSSTTIGTDSLSANAYPTPFVGFWKNAKTQMLYTAAELNASGFTGGKITSAAFNVKTKASTQPYDGFTIKMKCTNVTALSNSAFETSLIVVYGPTDTSTVLGWNTYNFTTEYEWDGVSNIVVEVCFSDTSWSGNDVVEKTATTFSSATSQFQDPIPGCNLSLPTTYNQRPNIKFEHCGILGAGSPNYTYSWSPSNGVLNPGSQNTGAVVTNPTTYSVIVTDTVTGCSGSASINIDATVCLGIVEANNSNIIIYPNPINDYLNISNPDQKILNYEVYDVTGKLIIKENKSANSAIEIKLNSIEKGVYILKIKEDNRERNFKIIKQ